MEVLQKFRASFEINEDQETTELDAYKDRIMVFQQYLKKAIGIMEMQRKQMKTNCSQWIYKDKQWKQIVFTCMYQNYTK